MTTMRSKGMKSKVEVGVCSSQSLSHRRKIHLSTIYMSIYIQQQQKNEIRKKMHVCFGCLGTALCLPHHARLKNGYYRQTLICSRPSYHPIFEPLHAHLRDRPLILRNVEMHFASNPMANNIC